jgi:cation-transporting ATPase E
VVQSFALMETLSIEPKVISGDHPRTVVGILRQLGVTVRGEVSGDTLDGLPDEAFRDIVEHTMVFGRISPALKARIVGALKENGHFVAMVGDGANDVPALREADVAVAMASGTAMARGVAGIVLLRDSFAALIRGTREATFVLGNTGLLAKLFVAKSVYAYVLILATNLLGLEFPFLPRQGGVVSTLSLGIPALLVSVSNPPSTSTHDFTMRIVRFALPAGVALGACTMGLQFIVEGLLGRSVEESRTLVSLTLTIVGLAYFVEVFGLDEPRSRLPWRALVAAVVALLLLMVLVATVQTEWTRTFFEFAEVSAIGWTSVAVASIVALLGRYWLSRNWRRIVAFFTAQPSAEDRPRGRAL